MINDLKDFERFLKICRKAGVAKVTIAGIALELGEDPKRLQALAAEGEIEDEPEGDDLIFQHVRHLEERSAN